jgi:outer membrane protein
MKELNHPIITMNGSDMIKTGDSFLRVPLLRLAFIKTAVLYSLLLLSADYYAYSQSRIWSFDDCIRYALEKNIQVQKAQVSNKISEINLNYARSAWYPSFSGSVRQNFDWSNEMNTTTGATVFKGNDGTNLSLNSGISIYNGGRLRNSIKRSETESEADRYNTEVIKETVSLNVLNAYLQVLYSEERVKNSRDQIASTEEQLRLAEERLKLGVIANSEYLQVKSQLANERQTLATAQSQLSINRIALMQLMELPETSDFTIEEPDLDSLVNQKRNPDPAEVYKIALGIKPEVKNAGLLKKSSEISIDLAKAGFLPNITLNAGMSTLYSGTQAEHPFGYQLRNNISPTLGLTASIPIYLNRQVRTNVEIAKKNTDNAELDEINVRNQLRKSIEQACQDVISSETEYEASAEAYKAARESFDVASEKFFQGIVNSVDYIIQKTNFITAESTFLQSKYKLVFSYKVLDFYTGIPLTFKRS